MRFRLYDIAPDLLLADNLPQAPRRDRMRADWSMLFYPANHLSLNPDMTLESEKLTMAKLQ